MSTNGFSQSGRGDRVTGASFATRSPVLARQGIAATSHPLASQVAIDILKQGGTAVDAAIAANSTLGLMEPTGCGIGGDLFALVWSPADRKLFGLNASGPAPKGLTFRDMLTELNKIGLSNVPSYGPFSVTVPGAVAGWYKLHERFGKLSMDTLLQPAIEYAESGFAVTQVVARDMAFNLRKYKEEIHLIPEFENFQKTFLHNGRMPLEGEVFRNQDLAQTLRTIAAGGRDAFYRGAIAQTIDTYARKVGLRLRISDLNSFEAEWVEPLSTDYRGYRVYELPPNSQGLAALQMLNILEGFDLQSLGHNSVDFLHLQVEAKKLAFEDRARYYADPRFSDIPVEWLISKEYAKTRRIKIDHERAKVYSPGTLPELGDTVYLTVADSSGLMVSLIQSNYLGMGSGLVADGTGFVLQNRGALFSLDPEHPNAYVRGKRPFHTIIPAFVTKDGQPFLSFGVMGGAFQPQGHVQILCNIIDFKMNVQEAGDAARYRHAGNSQPTSSLTGGKTSLGVILVESGVSQKVREGLQARGHEVQVVSGAYGGYQAIRWDPVQGVYHGGSEMRKDGAVIGY